MAAVRYKRGGQPLTFVYSGGKGYNEYLMISEAVRLSQTLRGCTHFMKITGRHAIINIRSMLREAQRRGPRKVFMADVQDTRLYDIIGRRLRGHLGDSRYWVAQTQWWREEMMECYKDMYEERGQFAEYYILWMSRRYRRDARFSFRFRTQVRFSNYARPCTPGDIASGRGRRYALRVALKDSLHQALRWLLPWWWI